jgi:hypothetical protein
VIAWYWFAIGALGLTGAISAYVFVAWRHAPRASRAMKWVAVASLATGILTGVSADQIMRQLSLRVVSNPFNLSNANLCSPEGFPAADLGKAIVLTNQKHAGDPNWVDPMSFSSLCSLGPVASDDQLCEEF